LQSAYFFWVCSMHLPLYLTPIFHPATNEAHPEDPEDAFDFDGPREPVRVDACGSVCRDVETKCPFFILGTEDDKGEGNPSFICKGEDLPKDLQLVLSWVQPLRLLSCQESFIARLQISCPGQ
jgi:hypothetical protein